MRYRFDQFELDTEQFSLRASGANIHVEPLVFDLLRFFVESRGHVLSREAVIERVWKGRFVSDATVSSCIKSARKALGDSGESQTYIRTLRGRGFQFTASVETGAINLETVRQRSEPRQTPSGPLTPSKVAAPPTIAVLPLFALSGKPQLGLLGDALSQEVILELSRLHWLSVIARGSSFQFRGQAVDLPAAHRILGADYFLTGTIMTEATKCVITVELCSAPDCNVVWADCFTMPVDEIMHMRSALAAQIVSALEPRIQVSEALQAAKVPTEHLDAWASYHRGLRHMYRFNKRDNDLAAQFFAHSAKTDPEFARAHAGLSFTHFQNAFLGFSANVDEEKQKAKAHAIKGLELDPLDPFVNLTMGRSEWLAGDLEVGQSWMERSVSLRPNYAFAIYNSALVGTLLGEGDTSEQKVAKAILLSPIDPLNYAMLATRALTHAIRGDLKLAAEWSDSATRSPNAHVHIYAIAAISHELLGEKSKAAEHARHILDFNPHFTKSAFMKSFAFRDGQFRARVEQSLSRLGL